MSQMPVYYIPHGAGPCFFMDWDPPGEWDRTAAFLKGIAAQLPARPSAIAMVTAHWQAEAPAICALERPPLLFDYGGFPPETYALQYPAPGAPELAQQAARLLQEAGFAPTLDRSRGLDHGSFIPLMLMFPEADIPVLQLSVLASQDPAAHLQQGAALAPLREQGVLIVGSGMSWHNMRGFGDPRMAASSTRFADWLERVVGLSAETRHDALANWQEGSGADGQLAQPSGRQEHLMPLHVAAGAAGSGLGREVFRDQVLGVEVCAFRFD